MVDSNRSMESMTLSEENSAELRQTGHFAYSDVIKEGRSAVGNDLIALEARLKAFAL